MDDEEKLRDGVQKRLLQARRRFLLDKGLVDPSIFTKEDLGFCAVEEAYASRDRCGDSVNRAVVRASRSAAFHHSKQDDTVSKFLHEISGRGYYSYLRLRKLLNVPEERPRITVWRSKFFNQILSLVNPGGLVHIREGTFNNVAASVQDKPVSIKGVGPATIINPAANSPAFTYRSLSSYNFMGEISDMNIDGSAVTGSGGVKLDKVNHSFLRNLIIKTLADAINIGTCYNIHVSNSRISATGTNASGIKVLPASGGVSADFMLDNTTIHDSPYGLYFGEGANGPWVTNVVVLGSSIVGILLNGVWCGGFFLNVSADQCAGDGWVLQDTAAQYTIEILLRNCWGASCNHGLLMLGSYGARGVDDVVVSGSYFGNNKLEGVKLEGYVNDVILSDDMIHDNNTSNITGVDSTNLLLHNGPFFVDIKGCHLGWIYTLPSNREIAARLWNESGSPRNIISRFRDCTFRDTGSSSKAKVGLKNSGSYEIDFLFKGLNGVDLLPLTRAYVIEAGSTGSIVLQESEAWLSGLSSLGTPGVACEGMVVYVPGTGGGNGISYICQKKSDGTFEWTKFAESGVNENYGGAVGVGGIQTIPPGCSFTPNESQVMLSERTTGASGVRQVIPPDATNIYVQAAAGMDFNWRVSKY